MIQITPDGCEFIIENVYIPKENFLSLYSDESKIILDGLSVGVPEMMIRWALKQIEDANLELGRAGAGRAKRLTISNQPISL